MNIVRYVRVVNFRSHDEFFLECRKPTTLVIGENGSGKTSLLEAIYMMLVGKSFRGGDGDILKRGREFYRVEVGYGDGRVGVMSYDGVRRVFVVGDRKYGRLPRVGRYPVVCFVPDDLHLVQASPGRRREFFDRMIGQVDEGYHEALVKYNRALRQRNGLLKEGGVGRESIFAWDVMLAKYGSEMVRKRREWVGAVDEKLAGVYRAIAGNQDEVGVRVEGEECDESGFMRRLADGFGRDLMVGHTGFGPHRDDFLFDFNGELAESGASRGEVRSMMLALKFIEAEMVEEILGKAPVVLLDDIFSELDEVRQRRLVENFRGHQVVITSVGVPGGMEGGVRV
jgi:DNA replication and repair protein RecF